MGLVGDPGPPLERCLACEAVVSKARSRVKPSLGRRSVS